MLLLHYACEEIVWPPLFYKIVPSRRHIVMDSLAEIFNKNIKLFWILWKNTKIAESGFWFLFFEASFIFKNFSKKRMTMLDVEFPISFEFGTKFTKLGSLLKQSKTIILFLQCCNNLTIFSYEIRTIVLFYKYYVFKFYYLILYFTCENYLSLYF